MQHRSRRGSVLVAVLTVSLAACGGAPATTPTPTTAPSSTPAPTPDVAGLFRSAFAAVESGVLSMTGTATVGAVQLSLTGTTTSNGPDSTSSSTTVVGGVTSTTERVTLGGKHYVRTPPGPWLEDGATASSPDLGDELERIAGLVVAAGTESRSGQLLYRLVPPDGTSFDPAALGLGSAGATNVASTVTFYALEDGTPVAMTLTLGWSQPSGTKTVDASMELEVEFSELGVAHTIRAPSDIWAVATSTRYGYRVAHPGDWDFDQSDKTYDYFWSPGDTFVGAFRDKLPSGVTLNKATAVEVASLKSSMKAKSVENEEATLGGVKARLLSANGVNGGADVAIFEAITIKDGYIHYLIWFSPAGHESSDLTTFRQMMATFAFA